MKQSILQKKKYIILSLCVLVIITAISPFAHNSNTYANDQIGVVVNVTTTLNVRSGAGTSNSVIGSLVNGARVTVLGTAKAADGSTWYHISFVSGGSTVKGYVHSNYLQVTSVANDPSFETYMTQQGFPDSYKPFLRQIRAQYPKWVFVAQHTNLDWTGVINAQSVLGRNLVSAGSNASWKSFEKGAYNWSTNTWYGLDGTWVAASRQIIEYSIDPRNALNSTGIFQFEQLSYSSHHTAAGVSEILKNTFMNGSFKTPDTGVTYTYANTFVTAGQLANVSPYHLAARARQEQGNSGSRLAHGTVPNYLNYFNFFNIGAYPHSGRNTEENGALYAKGTTPANMYLPWTNQYKSILGGAVFLGSRYIGIGQDTLYLQKFNVVGGGGHALHTHQYMTNVRAPSSEAISMKSAYSDAMLDSALVFKIPVYLNMPADPAPLPSTTGDNNNLLRSLGISGHTITPSFDMYTQTYELVVENNVSSVNINAVAAGSAATVSGAGNVSLNVGNNAVNIVVKSSSGVNRTYRINITRKQSTNPATPTPAPTTPRPTTPTPVVTTPSPTTAAPVATISAPITSVPATSAPATSNPPTSTPTRTPSATPVTTPAIPSITSNRYKIGSVITGVAERTSPSSFLSGFNVTNGSVKVVKSSGSVHSQTEFIGTGSILQLYNSVGALYKLYPIIIYGDVNGDGQITGRDLLSVQKHILRIEALTGHPFTAANVTKSGAIRNQDLLRIQKHILKIEQIPQ